MRFWRWRHLSNLGHRVCGLLSWVLGLLAYFLGSLSLFTCLPCYPRYLGITRRSCLEAHMVLDMEYESRLTWAWPLRAHLFFFSARLVLPAVPASITTGLGLHQKRALAPWGNWSEVSWYVSYLIIITFLCMHYISFISDNCLDLTLIHLTTVGVIDRVA